MVISLSNRLTVSVYLFAAPDNCAPLALCDGIRRARDAVRRVVAPRAPGAVHTPAALRLSQIRIS